MPAEESSSDKFTTSAEESNSDKFTTSESDSSSPGIASRSRPLRDDEEDILFPAAVPDYSLFRDRGKGNYVTPRLRRPILGDPDSSDYSSSSDDGFGGPRRGASPPDSDTERLNGFLEYARSRLVARAQEAIDTRARNHVKTVGSPSSGDLDSSSSSSGGSRDGDNLRAGRENGEEDVDMDVVSEEGYRNHDDEPAKGPLDSYPQYLQDIIR